MSKSILHNIRILDFTWVLAGPYATRLLADFGAEVIKVQPRLTSERDDAFSRGYYGMWNRNKRGITLNLARPEGISLAKRLVGISDAIVENFTPRVMANLGLDYPSLRELKPDIIMVSLSLMGQTGPWRNYGGFGPTVHAFSGLTAMMTSPSGTPVGPGFSLADHVAGLYASMALLAALEYRRKTGKGQHIDISEVEGMTSLLGDEFVRYCRWPWISPQGNHPAAPGGVFRCRDGLWLAMAIFDDGEWQRFKKLLDNPPWTADAALNALSGRIGQLSALNERVAAWALTVPAGEALAGLQSAGIAAGLVRDAGDLLRDPHLKERGFFQRSAGQGDFLFDAPPMRLSAAGELAFRPAPLPGQDNDYVYGQLLGMDQEEMERLRADGVI